MNRLTNDEVVRRYAAASAAHDVPALVELRDGLVHRETCYWAAPFAAPDWRAPWVSKG